MWEQVLHTHPDRDFADLIVRGIWEGFRIGFHFSGFGSTVSCDRNTPSAQYLAEESRHSHIMGHFKQLPTASLIVSRFGVIPKRGRENKWRLIVDLSFPEGHSVNDGIDPLSCSLS